MANGNRVQPTATAEALSPKQERALAALLSEPTVLKAATAAGVGERTLHKWLREPLFAEAWRVARRDVVAHATQRLSVAAEHAVLVLHTVMVDKQTPASVRVSAAGKVLEFTYKAQEQEDILARLDALEQHK